MNSLRPILFYGIGALLIGSCSPLRNVQLLYSEDDEHRYSLFIDEKDSLFLFSMTDKGSESFQFGIAHHFQGNMVDGGFSNVFLRNEYDLSPINLEFFDDSLISGDSLKIIFQSNSPFANTPRTCHFSILSGDSLIYRFNDDHSKLNELTIERNGATEFVLLDELNHMSFRIGPIPLDSNQILIEFSDSYENLNCYSRYLYWDSLEFRTDEMRLEFPNDRGTFLQFNNREMDSNYRRTLSKVISWPKE